MSNQSGNGGGNSENNHNQRQGWRSKIPSADTSNAVATILLVIVGAVGVWEAVKTIELSDRAWISTVGAIVSKTPKIGQPLHYNVQIINSGKEPAIDMAFSQTQGIVDPPMSDDFSLMNLPRNETCAGLKPMDGLVSAPGTLISRGMDTGRGDKPLFIDDAIMSGHKFLYVQGCVAYRTFEKPHTSAYCYIFEVNPKVDSDDSAPPTSPPVKVSTTPKIPVTQAFSCRDGFTVN